LDDLAVVLRLLSLAEQLLGLGGSGQLQASKEASGHTPTNAPTNALTKLHKKVDGIGGASV
jgi:hypothetical protein